MEGRYRAYETVSRRHPIPQGSEQAGYSSFLFKEISPTRRQYLKEYPSHRIKRGKVVSAISSTMRFGMATTPSKLNSGEQRQTPLISSTPISSHSIMNTIDSNHSLSLTPPPSLPSPLTTNDNLRKEFISLINNTENCDLFYKYMKNENLTYVLEFYLACDGLRHHLDDESKKGEIINLINTHYIKNKHLSTNTKFRLSDDILKLIKIKLNKKEYDLKFYDIAQDYVFKYMLQTCYPKFLSIQQHQTQLKRQIKSQTYTPMHNNSLITSRKTLVFDQFKKQRSINNNNSQLSSPVITTSILNASTSSNANRSNIRNTSQLFDTTSLETTSLICEHDIDLNASKPIPRTSKITKHQQEKYSLAERDPCAFFEEVKRRLLYVLGEQDKRNPLTTTTTTDLRLSQSLNIKNKSFSFTDRTNVCTTTIDDDSLAVIDNQINRTIPDADNILFGEDNNTRLNSNNTVHSRLRHQQHNVDELTTVTKLSDSNDLFQRPLTRGCGYKRNSMNEGSTTQNEGFSTLRSFTTSDSGVSTGGSERNYEMLLSVATSSSIGATPSVITQPVTPSTVPVKRKNIMTQSIGVVCYPSLESKRPIMSFIKRQQHANDILTFKEFKELFKRTDSHRCFFKTTCTSDINVEKFVFLELTSDDEIVPFFDGKIILQLDKTN
ncbi:unnamed protein product [Didymodactylos carnosus]|uniref:Axin n=1 Tax=Didymodactylos carnosus TaxID=1234261 RepID=A0A813RTI6_9BILA|nr:unnamed protein product [Didymodactylos carnosus]CAF0814845.1 unnamed protein product [Didymodactylos carnosus]CAF3573871.1 unnamed protein product [Didymodactylos carnosus]CAF3598827.1 unnamed protein product [Didymodactylos carnosus]